MADFTIPEITLTRDPAGSPLLIDPAQDRALLLRTPLRNGTRYIPVRLFAGEAKLDTDIVADSLEDAIKAVRNAEKHIYGEEWAEENPVIAIVAVEMTIGAFTWLTEQTAA